LSYPSQKGKQARPRNNHQIEPQAWSIYHRDEVGVRSSLEIKPKIKVWSSNEQGGLQGQTHVKAAHQHPEPKCSMAGLGLWLSQNPAIP